MSYVGQGPGLKTTNIKRFDVTGSTSATHALSWTAPSEQTLWITINGVKQQDDAYTIAGSPTTVTLSSALVSADKLEIIGVVDMGVSTYPVDGSVSTATLGNSSVTTAKIAADAVTAAEIATNAVDTAEIAANAVGLAEMAGLARGSIIYGNASGDPAALTKGTADQVLKSDGTDIAWGSDEGLPTQTSNEGKALITDGTNASWFPRTNHNFLINGDFQVAQRGTSFTPSSSSGSSLLYTLDRYYGYRSAGTNASIMQQIEGSAPDGFQYHARMGRVDNTTASGYFIIGQQIETKNACALAGQTVCLSMWVKKHANFSGDFGIYVTTGTGTDQAAWDSIGGGWTGGASAYSSTTVFSDLTTSWVRRSVTFTVAAGTKEIAVKMHFSSFVGAAVTNDYVEVTGMQLELGTTPSQFDHKTYGQDLSNCKRYFQAPEMWIAHSDGSTATSWKLSHNFPVEMRAAPTITVPRAFSTTKNNANAAGPNAVTTPGTAVATGFHVGSFFIMATGSGSAAATNTPYGGWGGFWADAEL